MHAMLGRVDLGALRHLRLREMLTSERGWSGLRRGNE
jgi:hypothetical protein